MKWPKTLWGWLGVLLLVGIVGAGCLDVAMRGTGWVERKIDQVRNQGAVMVVSSMIHPRPQLSTFKLPGPPRQEPLTFTLNATNALRVAGHNDPRQERWADLAGNHYSAAFCRRFSYEDLSTDGPEVWIKIDASAPTLRGRLEARRLKPNFAYQIKLLGDWRDAAAAERIGYVGRWRLPGGGTNYTDAQYQAYADRNAVEAYILFDYFTTDANGDAVREFALDSSLHVLWNYVRQRTVVESELGAAVAVVVDSHSPDTYARPKATTTTEYLIAEREQARYPMGEATIRLPPGSYQAFFTLTEESFHSIGNDDGRWATVYARPITFTITAP